ncbi:mediator of RNA polymerase II transcription subunit 9-like [Phalaenopsis equestris]|uniref:mediator of RNA polymerase II transcription subunit 9-like n=1 Tax=Phalaenopsis equestris TaxID=78828 RepID=UPI0009E4F1F4|nr:mediator of RNA polymerase II transcription subunit 9-like [Phalaenopsis equestris]
MDHHFGGGNWMMVPTQNSIPQDHSSLQPQYYQQQQHQLQQHQLNQQLQQQQQQQQQHDHHQLQSLASHFHLLHLAESVAEAVESGTRDQHSEALINELTNNFEKCQQLLNSISASFTTKAMTVEGQKRKQEETIQLLNQRMELIAKYRKSVEEVFNVDHNM